MNLRQRAKYLGQRKVG